MSRNAGTALVAAGVTIVLVAGSSAATLCALRERAAHPDPSPGLAAASPAPDPASSPDAAGPAWARIDWEHWLAVNPAVAGWVSIPGTAVSCPVVQADASDPQRYLTHDVFGTPNPYGAAYLDADCAQGLLGSDNAIVYGHNADDGAMFADVARFADPEWAAAHSQVLVQTPQENRVFEVLFVQIVDNSQARKRTSFDTPEEQRLWLASQRAEAAVVLNADAEPNQTISLVTCAYGAFADERCVAVLAEKKEAA